MKKALWLPTILGVLFLLGLGAVSCVRPKPTPVAMVQATAAEAPKNLPTAIVIATSAPTTTIPAELPTAVESAPQEPVAGQTTDAPAEVVVVVEDTPAAAPPAAAEPTPAGGTQQPQGRGEVTYLVRWGDTLARIAQQHGTTITAIVDRNPQITDRNFVKAGTTLVVPVGAAAPSSSGTGTQPAQETVVYMVQRGDTLATIARRFGTSVSALMQANPRITNANVIWSGQRLIIPARNWGATRTHVVRYGDTLSAIARRYNTTVWSIVVRNSLANANVIYPGQVLVIP
ncbi:MAG: LysM peptidoglycan-binding domain-containing protein [Anaerolineae bacterium]